MKSEGMRKKEEKQIHGIFFKILILDYDLISKLNLISSYYCGHKRAK